MPSILLALSLAIAPGEPTGPPIDRCIGAPLQLSWSDLLVPSQMAENVNRPGCSERHRDAALRMPHQRIHPLTVGRLKLGTFQLAGETVGYGIDMIWGPEGAFHGSAGGAREEIRIVPQLYLPEKWERAIDTATYPALFIGGAAITTVIIMHALQR